MTDNQYQPWRTRETADSLTEHTTNRWDLMLKESRDALDDLSKLIHTADNRIQKGEKIIELLEHHGERVAEQAAELGSMEDRIFSRIDDMAKRVETIETSIRHFESEMNEYIDKQDELDLTQPPQSSLISEPQPEPEHELQQPFQPHIALNDDQSTPQFIQHTDDNTDTGSDNSKTTDNNDNQAFSYLKLLKDERFDAA